LSAGLDQLSKDCFALLFAQEAFMTTGKKTIFYFEDEPELLSDYFRVLREKHEVIVSANRAVIEQSRQQPIDLLIVDLMIHRSSFDEARKEVQNVRYTGVEWQQTGVEFLRRVRTGDYEEFGFPATIPIIAATAMVDASTREEVVEQLDARAYLEKPFSVDELEKAIEAILG
jgi:CheY-like chemotaxis protein